MRSRNARRAIWVGGALLAAAGVPGCGWEWQEGMCSEGEFPVYAVSNSHGGQCITDGEPVPDGLAAYPPGRVPEHVGDEYDRWPLAPDYPWRDEVAPELLRTRTR